MRIIVLLLLPLLVFCGCKKSSSEVDPDTLAIVDLDYAGQLTFTDSRDGQAYHYTTIGDYDWMTENLRYNAQGSKIYADKNVNLQWYGRLYTQSQAQTACPEGWTLPTTEIWRNLCEELSGVTLSDVDFPPPPFKAIDSVGGLLAFNATRSDKSTIWSSGNNKKSNKSGFYALPAGIYDVENAVFYSKGGSTTWWSNTLDLVENKYYTANIVYNQNKFYYKAFYEPELWMFSVRCVKAKQ